jgi:hypothetical protein
MEAFRDRAAGSGPRILRCGNSEGLLTICEIQATERGQFRKRMAAYD